MADVFTKAKRREVMSRIRGRGNKDTEEALAVLLRKARISGWRRHQPIFGKPDFVFSEQRLAVFVDGCFWHCCAIAKHSPQPKTRRAWWRRKLERNRARDKTVNRTLRQLGWSVLRIWEHELKNADAVMVRVTRALAKKPRVANPRRNTSS